MGPPNKFIKFLLRWFKCRFQVSFVNEGNSLDHSKQPDGFSCGIIAPNTIAYNVFGDILWNVSRRALERAQWFNLFASLHLKQVCSQSTSRTVCTILIDNLNRGFSYRTRGLGSEPVMPSFGHQLPLYLRLLLQSCQLFLLVPPLSLPPLHPPLSLTVPLWSPPAKGSQSDRHARLPPLSLTSPPHTLIPLQPLYDSNKYPGQNKDQPCRSLQSLPARSQTAKKPSQQLSHSNRQGRGDEGHQAAQVRWSRVNTTHLENDRRLYYPLLFLQLLSPT